jgi:hypothetical protein
MASVSFDLGGHKKNITPCLQICRCNILTGRPSNQILLPLVEGYFMFYAFMPFHVIFYSSRTLSLSLTSRLRMSFFTITSNFLHLIKNKLSFFKSNNRVQS